MAVRRLELIRGAAALAASLALSGCAHGQGAIREGTVTLNCQVNGDGSVTDCNVVSETPRGAGMAEEALKALRAARFDPRQVEGKPAGSRATFTIRFRTED